MPLAWEQMDSEDGGEWRRVERGEEGTEAPLSLGEGGGRGGLSPATGEEQDMYGFFRRGVKKPEVARLSISAETRGASGKVHRQVGGLV